jgi:hypothetical protein
VLSPYASHNKLNISVATCIQFHKKFDVNSLLNFFTKQNHGKLEKWFKKNIIGHYINVTEHGLAHGWENVQWRLMYIYFGTQQSKSGAAQKHACTRARTQFHYFIATSRTFSYLSHMSRKQ